MKTGRISLGICAMDKKARSKPMKEILARLPDHLFDIQIFGNDCILYEPVESWPIVSCLISFYSNGFPLHKAIEYTELRKPYLINDLKMQYNLQDRRTVYRILESNNIAVPRHVFVERDIPGVVNEIEEYDEYIVVNGIHLNKPLVEKPVDADDHNIYIYYPTSAGGGSKRLFRKVADRSSEFYPKENDIRREGSYVYEEFINTQGIDVKVYTVGPNYGHAQARKSPVVDGRVMRDGDGKEMHLPVILTLQEKEFAMKITRAFKQTVCGFDLLRVPGKSFVCDVNGWSFVKSSRKYYDDCARVLNEMMLAALRSHHMHTSLAHQPLKRKGMPRDNIYRSNSSPQFSNLHVSSPSSSPTSPSHPSEYQKNVLETQVDIELADENDANDNESYMSDNQCDDFDEELLCVLSVVRHGDRTPKQKIKIKLTDAKFLEFYHQNSKTCTSNIKLKSKSSLLEFLDLTKHKIFELESISEPDRDHDEYSKLCCIRDVLEDREINGLTRKIQFKPSKWIDSVALSNQTNDLNLDPELNKLLTQSSLCQSSSSDSQQACEVLCIVKWGGDLTPLGEKQAELLGERFRQTMYPDPSGGGILRLHSTFRHDLKIKASDEGRVMKTAAAFTKGLLELEGDLTPVLVSLVTVQEKNTQMLDNYDNNEVKSDLEYCKSYLNRVLQLDTNLTLETLNSTLPNFDWIMKANLLKLGNPRQQLCRMHELIKHICQYIQKFCLSHSPSPVLSLSPSSFSEAEPQTTVSDSTESTSSDFGNSVPYLNETFILMFDRWLKLDQGFFKHKEDVYDLSKVPELHDMARYDVLHNSHLQIPFLEELYHISKLFADCVVPQEYGITQDEKRSIGRKMCHALLHKIQYDLMIAQSGSSVDMQYMLDESHGDDLNIRTMGRCVRTRLYFTSESHLYTLFHVLGYSPLSSDSSDSPPSSQKVKGFFDSDQVRSAYHACELSYLAHITIRLFENKQKGPSDPSKYRCEILMSPGATCDPTTDKTGSITSQIVLNDDIDCQVLLNYLNEAIAGYESTKIPRSKSDNDSEMMMN